MDPVRNDPACEGDVGTHQFHDGSEKPWEFHRVWHTWGGLCLARS